MPEWPEEQWLVGEKETLGLYLTGHPIEEHVGELARFVTARLGELNPAQRSKDKGKQYNGPWRGPAGAMGGHGRHPRG